MELQGYQQLVSGGVPCPHLWFWRNTSGRAEFLVPWDVILPAGANGSIISRMAPPRGRERAIHQAQRRGSFASTTS